MLGSETVPVPFRLNARNKTAKSVASLSATKRISMKPTETVVTALRNAWPTQADEILATLKYDSLMGCWYFVRWGQYVGIESDGFIHT